MQVGSAYSLLLARSPAAGNPPDQGLLNWLPSSVSSLQAVLSVVNAPLCAYLCYPLPYCSPSAILPMQLPWAVLGEKAANTGFLYMAFESPSAVSHLHSQSDGGLWEDSVIIYRRNLAWRVWHALSCTLWRNQSFFHTCFFFFKNMTGLSVMFLKKN